MLQSLLKVGLFVIAGSFLKPRARGLVILLAFWLLIWFLQSEYLNYVDYTGDASFLIESSLIKVSLILLSLLLYILMVEFPLTKKNRKVEKEADIRVSRNHGAPEGDDGFDFLRNKKKLKGSSEQLLKKNK